MCDLYTTVCVFYTTKIGVVFYAQRMALWAMYERGAISLFGRVFRRLEVVGRHLVVERRPASILAAAY